MRQFLPIITLCFGAAAYAQSAEPTDTVAGAELQEVTVEARNAQLSAKGSTFYPSKIQKEAAQTATDLLRRMAIPQLAMNIGDAIKTVQGKEVTIFIDGVEASADDLQGMRTTDVKRVEYYDYPSDVKFQNKPHVINFIMQQYEYGGYVKGVATGYAIANSANLSLYSKLQYKRMTYDLAMGGYYSDRRHDFTNSVETFRLPQADGTVKEFERTSTTTEARRIRKYAWPTFKAQYRSDRVTLTNAIGATFDASPVKNTSGRVDYSSMFPSSEFSSKGSSNADSYTYYGIWNFIFSPSTSLNVTPKYTYTDTRSASAYDEGNKSVINNADDLSHSFSTSLDLSHKFGKAGSLTLHAAANSVKFNTSYAGTTNADINSTINVVTPGLVYSYDSDQFSIYGGAGAIGYNSNAGGEKESNLSPWVDASLQWSPSNRHNTALEYHMSRNIPGMSYRSNIEVWQNPLMAHRGNPNVHSAPTHSVSGNYVWIPTNKWRFVAAGSYWGVFNRYVYDYVATPDHVVRTIEQNGSNFHHVDYSLSGTLTLLGGKLMLSGQVTGLHVSDGAPYMMNRNNLSGLMYVQYYTGNWNFGGYAYTARSWCDNSMTGEWTTEQPICAAWAQWGNSTWSANLTIANPNNWKWLETTAILNTKAYSATKYDYNPNPHAFVCLTLTYTFGYGKKISVGNEATQQTAGESGIMK